MSTADDRLDEARRDLDAVRYRLMTLATEAHANRLMFAAIGALDIAHDVLAEVRYARSGATT